MKKNRGAKLLVIGVVAILGSGMANEKLERYKEAQPPRRPFEDIVEDFQQEAMAAHPGVPRQEALRRYHIDRINQTDDLKSRRLSAAAIVRSGYISSKAAVWVCEQDGVQMKNYESALEREQGGAVLDAANEPTTVESRIFSDRQIPEVRAQIRTQLERLAQEGGVTLGQVCEDLDSRADAIFPGELSEHMLLAKKILMESE